MQIDTSNLITCEELKKCMNQVILVDVRQPEEHEEGHLPGSLLIPLGQLQSRADSELKAKDPIVVYCAHGMRSLQAVMILKNKGFENVKSLTGGFADWK